MSGEIVIEFIKSVSIQFFGIFGVFIAFGFILSEFQRLANRNYMKAWGWRGILWTAWIGTPIHELGHIIFAILFAHRIDKVSFFKPDQETGMLGEVHDSYNPRSLYERSGNFFIGVGPLIIGSFALVGLLYWLVPNHNDILAVIKNTEPSLRGMFSSVILYISNLFAPGNLTHVSFWIFLYASFSIVSHMAPSRADLKRALDGLVLMVLMLIAANLIFALIKADPSVYLNRVFLILNAFLAIQIYAIVIAVMNLMLSSIVYGLVTWLKSR